MGDLKLSFTSYLFVGDKYAELEVVIPTDKGELKLVYELFRDSRGEVSQLFLDGKPLKLFQVKNFPRFTFNLVQAIGKKFGDKFSTSNISAMGL